MIVYGWLDKELGGKLEIYDQAQTCGNQGTNLS